jgi:phosphate starvation-inducible PhoH-like protein
MARSNKKHSGLQFDGRRKRHADRIIRIEDERREDTVRERKVRVDLIPRNLAQEEYIEHLNNFGKSIVFAIGPAGTGKTYLAVQKAIKDLKAGFIDKIVITRPAVSVDEKHGFLPGDLNKKMEPWTRPIFDVFEEYYSPREIKSMLEENVLEIAPLAYMRGRTFKNCTIIFDESQNTTPSQMKMALTRIGENCRMFVTGDLKQSDFKEMNGLHDFFNKIDGYHSSGIAVTRFTCEHIERAAIVEEVLRFYGEE